MSRSVRLGWPQLDRLPDQIDLLSCSQRPPSYRFPSGRSFCPSGLKSFPDSSVFKLGKDDQQPRYGTATLELSDPMVLEKSTPAMSRAREVRLCTGFRRHAATVVQRDSTPAE